jgi:hypothetical protein
VRGVHVGGVGATYEQILQLRGCKKNCTPRPKRVTNSSRTTTTWQVVTSARGGAARDPGRPGRSASPARACGINAFRRVGSGA